ncbi:MAG TPA: FHA domain-containing protein [Kofleriaceae bacterium]|nr:FHA domain-containing protein [Kofleriaceae bacterium]
MTTPFSVVARCEHKNVEPSTTASPSSRLWASIKVDPVGGGLERERAPLAVVLVVDVSGSMHGDPIAHVLRSCELLADLLTERDQLAIVTFSDHGGVRCGLTTMDAAGRVQVGRVLHGVATDGQTNLHGGLEVAAGVLMTAPAGLRRVMVVMSDGQPNIGLAAPNELASYVTGLKLAVSSLGFGLQHDENVLAALATAGSGRYAYIPDPVLARVDLARAALAHGGIIADQLELRIEPAEGVELLQIVPATPLRVGGKGLATPIGDVFVDEGRALAIELLLTLRSGATGRLAAISVSGRAPDGTQLRTSASLDVDIRAGAPTVDRDAQRDIVLVQAEAARAQARAQADRGALPAAVAILRQMIVRIEATVGFVRNDGSPLAELREQLEDEAANYERKSTAQERTHQRKATMVYTSATPGYQRIPAPPPAVPAQLVGTAGPLAGQTFPLRAENQIGRSASNDIVVHSAQLSRGHTRILFAGDRWMLQDLGSTSGSRVNGAAVRSIKLAHGDLIALGDAEFRFELVTP